ncbi:MAG: hypothetical protein OXC81_07720, partial [Betaproteobacteria bacterium]|nr:hypothetical protein [Betaproteobacteria bacterium]
WTVLPLHALVLAGVAQDSLRPLDFFLLARSKKNQQGWQNLCACLVDPDTFQSAGFKKDIVTKMNELLGDNPALCQRWREIIALDKWL